MKNFESQIAAQITKKWQYNWLVRNYHWIYSESAASTSAQASCTVTHTVAPPRLDAHAPSDDGPRKEVSSRLVGSTKWQVSFSRIVPVAGLFAEDYCTKAGIFDLPFECAAQHYRRAASWLSHSLEQFRSHACQGLQLSALSVRQLTWLVLQAMFSFCLNLRC